MGIYNKSWDIFVGGRRGACEGTGDISLVDYILVMFNFQNVYIKGISNYKTLDNIIISNFIFTFQ